MGYGLDSLTSMFGSAAESAGPTVGSTAMSATPALANTAAETGLNTATTAGAASQAASQASPYVFSEIPQADFFSQFPAANTPIIANKANAAPVAQQPLQPGKSMFGTIGSVGGGLVGTYFGGPVGGMIGSQAGKMAGDQAGQMIEGKKQPLQPLPLAAPSAPKQQVQQGGGGMPSSLNSDLMYTLPSELRGSFSKVYG